MTPNDQEKRDREAAVKWATTINVPFHDYLELAESAYIAGLHHERAASAGREIVANQAAVGPGDGFTFSMDPSVPENEVHLRLNGKTVGRIVNVSHAAATEGKTRGESENSHQMRMRK